MILIRLFLWTLMFQKITSYSWAFRCMVMGASDDEQQKKDEQWKIQQDILARRRNKSNMKKYFDQVTENRKELSSKAKGTLWARTNDSVDPIDNWKGAKAQGMIKPIGYEAEPSRNESKLGFNVIIPINPMGIPKYDNGERFDLRLPYAERGYEDESADFMGNLMKGFRGLFGGKPSADGGKVGKLKDKTK